MYTLVVQMIEKGEVRTEVEKVTELGERHCRWIHTLEKGVGGIIASRIW